MPQAINFIYGPFPGFRRDFRPSMSAKNRLANSIPRTNKVTINATATMSFVAVKESQCIIAILSSSKTQKILGIQRAVPSDCGPNRVCNGHGRGYRTTAAAMRSVRRGLANSHPTMLSTRPRE